MLKVVLVLFGCAALAQDDEVARDAIQGYVHPWDGFGVGSSVVFRETSKASTFNEAEQKVVYKDLVIDSTWTVKKVAPESILLNMRSGGSESDVPYFTGVPPMFRGKGEQRGTAEVAVGGRKFRCAVTAITFETGGGLRQVATIYKATGAPTWAVKWTVETYQSGEKNTSEEELLVALNENVTIEKVEVPCHVVQVTTEVVGQRKTVRREWRTERVPGRVARRETRFFEAEKEVEAAATTMVVVSFTGKR